MNQVRVNVLAMLPTYEDEKGEDGMSGEKNESEGLQRRRDMNSGKQ